MKNKQNIPLTFYLKREFIKTVINTEVKEIEKEIQILKNDGIIYNVNGHNRVSWNPYNDQKKCLFADKLLYQRNRVVSLNAVRQTST